jgi:hypothetical protein
MSPDGCFGGSNSEAGVYATGTNGAIPYIVGYVRVFTQ